MELVLGLKYIAVALLIGFGAIGTAIASVTWVVSS